jgi:predicted methyltransferase
MEWGVSRCGEGTGSWAIISDVIGPKGETLKSYPDGRSEISQPTEQQRAALDEILNEAEGAAANEVQ